MQQGRCKLKTNIHEAA